MCLERLDRAMDNVKQGNRTTIKHITPGHHRYLVLNHLALAFWFLGLDVSDIDSRVATCRRA